MYFALRTKIKNPFDKKNTTDIYIYISKTNSSMVPLFYNILYLESDISSCDFYIIRIAMDFFTSPTLTLSRVRSDGIISNRIRGTSQDPSVGSGGRVVPKYCS